jgi:hypothetical protein
MLEQALSKLDPQMSNLKLEESKPDKEAAVRLI